MKERESNLELLRIFSMFLIIGYHMVTNGLFVNMGNTDYSIWFSGSRLNQIITAVFYPAGRIGVLLFFMITGYFLIDKEYASPKKVLVKTLFYCFFLNVVFLILQYTIGIYTNDFNFSWKTYVLKNFLIPISSGTNWFATMYIVLLLCLPLLNKFLKSLTKKQFILFLLFVNLFWFGFGNFFTVSYEYIYETVLFYSMGSFVRLFVPKIQKHKNKFLVLLLIIFFWACACFISEKEILSKINESYWFIKIYDYILKSGFVIIIGFLLFILFNSFNLGSIKFINKLSSTTLSVYLIHGSVFQLFFWENVFDIKKYYYSNIYVLFIIVSSIIVYVISSIFDLFFSKLILNKFYDYFSLFFNKNLLFKETKCQNK